MDDELNTVKVESFSDLANKLIKKEILPGHYYFWIGDNVITYVVVHKDMRWIIENIKKR